MRSFVKDWNGGTDEIHGGLRGKRDTVQAPSLTVDDGDFQAKVEAVHAVIITQGLEIISGVHDK